LAHSTRIINHALHFSNAHSPSTCPSLATRCSLRFSNLSVLFLFSFFTAGFIGSHTALALLEHGYNITIIDNLDNSFQLAIDRVKELAGEKAANMTFIKEDLRNYEALDKIFSETKYVLGTFY
jgi:hypothetical protein